MHKLLLALLLSIVLILPNSEVFAGCPAGEEAICPPGTDPVDADTCKNSSGGTVAANCRKIGEGGPGTAPGTGVTTTGPTTSAKGIPCGTITGSLNYSGGIMTAIGCIPTEPKALVEGLLKYGTFAAGGVAFLIMILAALQMITAEGNPEAIKAGQEKFYSAIIGLLLIIFAVLLMQVIGVDILGLPDLKNPLPRGEPT